MKALVLKDYRRFTVEDVQKPSVQSDEVLVRVRACGICGSDVHGMDGRSGRRIPPIIMGHEAAGEISEVGAAVSGWKAGDRVTFDSTVWCGRCWHCRRGEVNLCDDRRVLGGLLRGIPPRRGLCGICRRARAHPLPAARPDQL